MKLTTKREELVSKLSVVSRAVSTRAATQALSGVLLTAREGKLTLAATDLDLGLETTLEAEIEDAGTTLQESAPAHSLLHRRQTAPPRRSGRGHDLFHKT